MNRNRRDGERGQSIVEYLIVAAALILAFATFGTALTGGVTQVGADARTAMESGGDTLAGITIGEH